MYNNDDNGSDGPKGTFEIYRAEADSLYKQGEYRKAIESYTIVSMLFSRTQKCNTIMFICFPVAAWKS